MASPPPPPTPSTVIELEYTGRVAIITINNAKKLNALNQEQYYDLAQKMREVATHDEVFVTLLIGRGRYFSAGADVSSLSSSSSSSDAAPSSPSEQQQHAFWLRSFAAPNLNIAHAFYTHPKILVVGMNGPAVGLSAALVGAADFVYCAPRAFLLTPFSSLGLVAEGAASRALARRLGPARAADALIASRAVGSAELLACGFANAVLDPAATGKSGEGGEEDQRFREMVLREIDDRLGDHLSGSSMLRIKALMRGPEMDILDAQNVKEVFGGLDRFVNGIPQAEFEKIASGKKRHKL